MTDSILNGKYVYEEVYPSFKTGTDEKEKTAQLNQFLLKNLAREAIVLRGDKPLKIADVGCGPADTVLKYLKGVEFEPGFTIRATDYLEDYAGANGKAAENLRMAQTSGLLKINGFSVKRGDAFAGKLADLLSTPEDPSPYRSFGLSFLSHLMYHAHRLEEIDTVLEDIARNILDNESVAILYHVAHRSVGTFQYFRDRFGSRADNTQLTDTPTMNIHDPPTVIQESCLKNQIPCFALEFSTQLFFEDMRDEFWEKFKYPENYQELSNLHPGPFENLKRLYFVVQRSPREFAEDSSSTGLNAYLEEVREAIRDNHGALPLEETLQVITPPEASSIFQDKVRQALAITREAISLMGPID